jgi:hydroxyacylglutathione hydrolase
VVPVEIVSFVDEGLGHSSYLVDLGTRRALVVDPPRLPLRLLLEAAARDVAITWTADTHSHADYVSGSPELEARGATFIASAAAGLEVPNHGLVDGDEIALGNGLALVAIATPGHTPDHLAYLLVQSGVPIALFSGGSLMVGTVGRTDLLGPELHEALTRQLFHALQERILTLPDDVAVYPTHGAGSFCSAPGASERSTTIGRERATNALLAIDDEDAFVERMLASSGTFPSYFSRLPEVNRRGPRIYDALPELAVLDLDAFRRAVDRGAVVVDVRPVAAFAAGHMPGALSNVLRPVFASWLGWLVDAEAKLVFVVDDDQDLRELVRQCLSVGYEHLVGRLEGGMTAWIDAGLPTASIALVDADAIEGGLLDVRQASEFGAGHVPGARNVELGSIRGANLSRAPLTVMCGHGERAMTAASLLRPNSTCELRVLLGGPDDWATLTGRKLEPS